jgi:hypothetical protein
MARFEAVEVTAYQAFFLADYLGAGVYPWKLAITGAYVDPAEREPFNAKCIEELTAAGVMDTEGRVTPSVAQAVRTVCRPRQWLEWYTVVDADQMLRGVLARTTPPDAVVALRYAQMVTFTPLQLIHSEAVVPIITAGLPQDQPPAQFEEFELPMDVGRQIDDRIARGADVAETLTDLGIDERAADVMELARTGKRITVELTAHDAGDSGRQQTDVSVNLISTEVGLILVSPPAGEPRDGGVSIFAPGEPFAISMAIRDLTARLPSGTWFPDENYDI